MSNSNRKTRGRSRTSRSSTSSNPNQRTADTTPRLPRVSRSYTPCRASTPDQGTAGTTPPRGRRLSGRNNSFLVQTTGLTTSPGHVTVPQNVLRRASTPLGRPAIAQIVTHGNLAALTSASANSFRSASAPAETSPRASSPTHATPIRQASASTTSTRRVSPSVRSPRRQTPRPHTNTPAPAPTTTSTPPTSTFAATRVLLLKRETLLIHDTHLRPFLQQVQDRLRQYERETSWDDSARATAERNLTNVNNMLTQTGSVNWEDELIKILGLLTDTAAGQEDIDQPRRYTDRSGR